MSGISHYTRLLAIMLVLALIVAIVLTIVLHGSQDNSHDDSTSRRHKHILYILADDLGFFFFNLLISLLSQLFNYLQLMLATRGVNV